MTAHEQLVAARNLIDRTGWACGSPSERAGPGLCVEEALGIVLGYPDWERQSSWIHESEACRVLSGQVGLRGFLYFWNDSVCRNKAQALDLFDRAIAATAPEPDPERVYTSDDRVLFTTGPTRVYIDGVKV